MQVEPNVDKISDIDCQQIIAGRCSSAPEYLQFYDIISNSPRTVLECSGLGLSLLPRPPLPRTTSDQLDRQR